MLLFLPGSPRTQNAGILQIFQEDGWPDVSKYAVTKYATLLTHIGRERVKCYDCCGWRTSELQMLSCSHWCGCSNGYHKQLWFCKKTAKRGPSKWEKGMVHSHFRVIKQNNVSEIKGNNFLFPKFFWAILDIPQVRSHSYLIFNKYSMWLKCLLTQPCRSNQRDKMRLKS